MVETTQQVSDAAPQPANLAIPGRPSQPAQAVSVAQLVEARDAAGMTAADVAARLGMTVRQIEYLESGAWDRLPGRPFIVSALRAYGRAVRVDVELLVNSVRGSVQTAETLRPVAQLDQPMPRRGALGFGGGGSGSFRTWLIFILVLILALAFFYGGGATYLGMSAPPFEGGRRGDAPLRNGSSMKPVPPATNAPAKTDSTSSSAIPAATSQIASASLTAAPTSPVASAASAGAPAASAAPGAGPASADLSTRGVSSLAAADPVVQAISGRAGPVLGGSPSPAPTADAGTTRAMGAAAVVPVPAADLVLSFDIESWIEIKDADGRVLVVGTERPGSTRAVEGRGPFSLIIGNAPGVRLSYRGRPVNLEPHTQRGIARLVVE